MGYISTEDVVAIKKSLHKEFDGKTNEKLKFSVSGGNSSELRVVILEGSFYFMHYDRNTRTQELILTNENVNHYCLDSIFGEHKKSHSVLTKILEIINLVKENDHDGDHYADYGPRYNYFIDLKIGTHNKHYKKVNS